MVVDCLFSARGWSPGVGLNIWTFLFYSTGFILMYLDEMTATKMVANVKQAANM